MKRFANNGDLTLPYTRRPSHIKSLVNEKMKVLRDFYIVDSNNESQMKKLLEQAIGNHPNSDPQVVLDHAASVLIKKKFREI